MPRPYIGVTGFMRQQDVATAMQTFEHNGLPANRQLGVGVLVSAKTFDEQPNKYPNRYPNVMDIGRYFPPHRLALNLIHFSTDTPERLPEQLKQLTELGGRWLDGFQLNVVWPDLSSIEFPPNMRVVLQIGERAIKQAGNDPHRVVEWIGAYLRDGKITDVLLDASGGKGVPLDPSMVRRYAWAIRRAFNDTVGIGIAGGLCAENLESIGELVREFPNLSIDAEGQLRTPEDHLDINKMISYIHAAVKLFRR